jgi:hypothetical protein
MPQLNRQGVEQTPLYKRGLNRAVWLVIGTILLPVLGFSGLGAAQSFVPLGGSSPIYGNTGGMAAPSRLPGLTSSPNQPAQIHTGPTGKACLSVVGQAQEQTVNPNIFDHVIVASNDCSRPIQIRVCYYQSQECTLIDVPSYGHKEAVLGIMPAMKDFRFEYTEKFDRGFRAN